MPLQGPASYAISVAFSPGGRILAVGSADRTVRLWNVADRARLGPAASLTGPAGDVYSVSFSPDGRTLAAGVTDGTVWLWQVTDPARPSLVASLTGPARAVYLVTFALAAPPWPRAARTALSGCGTRWPVPPPPRCVPPPGSR